MTSSAPTAMSASIRAPPSAIATIDDGTRATTSAGDNDIQEPRCGERRIASAPSASSTSAPGTV
mgnify:CR=1 FL=1